jgi:predicted nucleic acid-binding Zn ribbon protein
VTGEVRHCIKCGREIGPDETICEICNRAGMATPSASQYHATMVAAIVIGVVLLAVAASIAMTGVGPFQAQTLDVRAGADGVQVTVAVTNDGSKQGRAKCQLISEDRNGRSLDAHSTVSPPVPAGERITFVVPITRLSAVPASVTVSCT